MRERASALWMRGQGLSAAGSSPGGARPCLWGSEALGVLRAGGGAGEGVCQLDVWMWGQ